MMATICQIIVLVDLTLLAIAIALFVFASSIYKGAIKMAISEEEGIFDSRKKLIQERKQEIQKEIKSIKEENFAKELRKRLDELEADIRFIDSSIKKSREKAKALSLKNMVNFPVLIIILSLIASGIAIWSNGYAQTSFGIISIAFMGGGMYLIYRNLNAMENISSVIDLSTLMEQALDAHEMKNEPALELTMWTENLEVERGGTLVIEYDVHLKRGKIGRNARCRFTATKELEFPEEEIEEKTDVDYGGMKKPNIFVHGYKDINPKEYDCDEILVKAPDKPGNYTMSYWLQCDGFTEDEYFFKIKVT